LLVGVQRLDQPPAGEHLPLVETYPCRDLARIQVGRLAHRSAIDPGPRTAVWLCRATRRPWLPDLICLAARTRGPRSARQGAGGGPSLALYHRFGQHRGRRQPRWCGPPRPVQRPAVSLKSVLCPCAAEPQPPRAGRSGSARAAAVPGPGRTPLLGTRPGPRSGRPYMPGVTRAA